MQETVCTCKVEQTEGAISLYAFSVAGGLIFVRFCRCRRLKGKLFVMELLTR